MVVDCLLVDVKELELRWGGVSSGGVTVSLIALARCSCTNMEATRYF